MNSFYNHFLIFSLLLIVVKYCLSLPNVIRIGGLFGDNSEEQEMVFRFAVERINADTSILYKSTLVAQVERIRSEDSFHGDKKVCSLLRNGVVAIFDPLQGSISNHVQSICDAMDIPHVEIRWDSQFTRDDLSINLYPRPAILAKAFIDLVKFWNWDRFVILYEDNDGLVRLQDFLKIAHSLDWKIKLYQFKPGKPYRDTFWSIKDVCEFNIILDVKKENMFKVLKQAQQVGLMTEHHNYLITLMDLHTIDLEDFKFGKTKIASFRMVNSMSPELNQLLGNWSYLSSRLGRRTSSHLSPKHISTDSALIYDAVKLLAIAVQDLDQSQAIDVQQISCESGVPWVHGSSLINYMRPITFHGITGLVEFDQLGFRTNITLDVMAISPDGLEKIGTWTEETRNGSNLDISEKLIMNEKESLENTTIRITTILTEPYTMIKESSSTIAGTDMYEGFAIDLITELSKHLHFKYTINLVKDNAYGKPDKNGTWNGLIGEIIRGDADIAVADLTITHKREEAVDFTQPYMNTGISILFKKPTKKVSTLFSFLSPFHNVVWIYVVAAYVGVSSMLFVVGRLSPYEWDNPHPCRRDGQVLENAFSLSNSFWFTIGSLMQQGSDLNPRAMSTRTIAAIWYFFTLIMIASYTANLAAFLTVEKIEYPIENAEDLAAQEMIKYGCVASGSTASFFQESNITTYKKMWEFMSKHQKEVLMGGNEAGMEKVKSSDGMYAFLMESVAIEYRVERNCNLTQIGGLLDSKGYGIATKKDSPLRMKLSQAILKLSEGGTIHILKDRWWKQKRGGGQCFDETKQGSGRGSVNPLKIDNVGGVFVVLLGGFSLALFVAICEFMWKSKDYTSEQDTICEEMLSDLKFAFSCQSSSKPIRMRDGCDPYDNEKSGLPPQFSTIY